MKKRTKLIKYYTNYKFSSILRLKVLTENELSCSMKSSLNYNENVVFSSNSRSRSCHDNRIVVAVLPHQLLQVLRLPCPARRWTQWNRCSCAESEASLPELLFQRWWYQIQLRVENRMDPPTLIPDSSIVVVVFTFDSCCCWRNIQKHMFKVRTQEKSQYQLYKRKIKIHTYII